MAEVPGEPHEERRILGEPNGAGQWCFKIEPGVRGCDVMATLEFTDPQPEVQQEYVEAILQQAVLKGVFNNKHLNITDPIGRVAEEVEVTRFINLGHPVLEDIKKALALLFSEEAVPEKLEALLIITIDTGLFGEANISIAIGNEIITANDETIGRELAWWTEEFYPETDQPQ